MARSGICQAVGLLRPSLKPARRRGVVPWSWCSGGVGSLLAMMTRRPLIIAAVMLGVLGAAGSASAATTCKTVTHKVHAKHWVWRKEVRKVHGRLRVEIGR